MIKLGSIAPCNKRKLFRFRELQKVMTLSFNVTKIEKAAKTTDIQTQGSHRNVLVKESKPN